MSDEKTYYGLNYDDFFEIIENLYDEIWVYDNNYNMIYANQATHRHYGKEPNYFIGKNFHDMVRDNEWTVSVLPHVYKDKKCYAIRQSSYIGVDLINIATPIFDKDGEIKYVAMSVRDSLKENSFLKPPSSDDAYVNSNDIIAQSLAMKDVLKIARKISNIDSTCLITGESGTGKTMLAKYIHDSSNRKDKPFVNINCSSIPTELLESELFGYRKGAFTGAMNAGKIGLLEYANGGTVLFDEVSEMSPIMQTKLLNVIQEKEFIPIGAVKPIKVDIKIVCATNKDLRKLTETGLYREDLFYRLNVFELYMPPLRERKTDIEPLIYYFMNKFCEKYNVTRQISKETLDILVNHSWKGNIRELSHVIERLVIVTDELVIEKNMLPSSIFEYTIEDSSGSEMKYNSFDNAVEQLEEKLIKEAYAKYKTTRKIAEALSLSQTRVFNLIHKYIKQ